MEDSDGLLTCRWLRAGVPKLYTLEDDADQVGMNVKLGAVTMQYRGQMTVQAHDVALSGTAVLDRLSSLPKLVGLLAAVAFDAYRIGRRAGGR